MNTSAKHTIIPGEADFTHLFRQCYSRLCLFAHGFVNDKQRSEDIVQDCFVKLWERRTEVSWSGSIPAYLYTMVRNACLNERRDAKHTASLPDLATDEENFLNRIIEAETLYEVYRAIRLLPPKCGDIFTALFVEGKKINEVSRELKVTESTIRSHKAAALLFLRRLVISFLFFSFIF
ncbi:MAG: RNA polymerase sigma-70 factor [Chitinophagaceae bacterium]|nr:RNA polymerase sigma-70 factor [Chitinophagaceae bacterium]